jgi:hypothetical protein
MQHQHPCRDCIRAQGMALRRLGYVVRHVCTRAARPEPERPGPEQPLLPLVSALPLAEQRRPRLTPAELEQFEQRGFVSGLPVLASAASQHLVAKYREIECRLAALPQPLSTHEVYWFFKASRWIYELTMLDAIHDYVESLLGPDFFLCEWHAFHSCPSDMLLSA